MPASMSRLLMVPLVPVLLLSTSGRAEVPLPVYPECGEPDRPELCPVDLEEYWSYLSYIPRHSRESVRPAELEMGAGMWVDRAWRQTTGRFDVVLAIGDSGVRWHDGDIVNKLRLNTDELPLPQRADGSEIEDGDLDGNGLHNIKDWAEDPRVDPAAGQDLSDDRLDPSDLIATFSDGIDDDENGYPDDICGWDFFDEDNDPFAALDGDYGTHGNGVAERAAGEGGDGGIIGVCPNCSILPVRVGDTFITDGSRAARGIAYAADQGAVVISLAIGAMSNPDFARQAARRAFEQGLVMVGASGDENSYHHNFPAVLPEALYVHSVRWNTASEDGAAYSYLNTLNCNNFGARLDLVAPERVCATTAVAMTTGAVGLVQSAARDAGTPLHAGEVVQLLVQTADDVWLTEEEREISGAWPSQEGWDPFYGYGRVNVARAIDKVTAGEIPPWLRIDSPGWFDMIDPAAGALEVSGTISAERAERFSWLVELGIGHDPRRWEAVGQGEGSGTEELSLATLDLGALDWRPVTLPSEGEGVLDRLERVNRNAVTLRLTVVDDQGRQATARRTFFLDDDPDRLPGFPIRLDGSAEASPVLSDLDGDGIFEIILATADGEVLALDGRGEALPGFPVRVDSLFPVEGTPDGILAAPAVGDIDGDGQPEVVAATFGGGIYAWQADGSRVDGFPAWTLGRDPDSWEGTVYNFDQGIISSPVLADIDDDGALEIIVAGMDSRLYVLDGSGQSRGPYPVEICEPGLCGIEGYRIVSSPAVGDVDGDGDLDIGLGTNETPEGSFMVVHMLDASSGTALPGWPIRQVGIVSMSVLLPLIGEGHPSSLAFVDLDQDGDLEIADPILANAMVVLDHEGHRLATAQNAASDYGSGSNLTNWLATSFLGFANNAGWGDIDQDGVPDLVSAGAGIQYLLSLPQSKLVDYQLPVAAWSGAGVAGGSLPLLDAFPRQIEDIQLLHGPAIADLTGDGLPEAIHGSAGYILHAWDREGREPEGWPKHTGGWLLGAPAVGDIDGDGYLEVVAATREGWLWAWRTEGRADQRIEWASFRHDPQNTGNYETPLLSQAGPTEPAARPEQRTQGEGGCCRARGDEKGALVLLLPLLSLGALRRRRKEG